ncbi:MAG: DNA-protecting protein DprA [Candidatus Latescibacteria bacterium]|nr:DNA-protecting protein DprA [Candidatus Latescibacterota bacterium]
MNIHALLTLHMIPGIGPNRLRMLVNHFETPEAVLTASGRDLMEVDGIDDVLSNAIRHTRPDDQTVTEQLDTLDRCGGRIVTWWDGEYPSYLKEIYDPPTLLFVRGTLPTPDEVTLAVVGSRVATPYGRTVTERLVGGLTRHGITIVSGMARGIDGIAHRAALSNGGRTIGVLGCGLDVVYPAEHKKLYDEVSVNGAILSECPMGTAPEAHNFPRRNRMISGLSLGVLVVEAQEKSGALLTAKLALDQGRDVFAVPGNIDASRSRGTNRLIQQGAKLVLDIEDILDELTGPLGGVRPSLSATAPGEHLSEEEKGLLDRLSPSEPRHIDALSVESGLPSSKALALLLPLELAGLVRQLSGKHFVRVFP